MQSEGDARSDVQTLVDTLVDSPAEVNVETLGEAVSHARTGHVAG